MVNADNPRPPDGSPRPKLTPEDLCLVQTLSQPGETVTQTIRRILRDAVERRTITESLRAIEERLARIEACGLAVVTTSRTTDPHDAVERTRAALSGRFALDNEEED